MMRFILVMSIMTTLLPASDLDAAREHYRQAVAAAFGIAAAKITVQPVHVGLPENPYEHLQTGDLFALRADWPGADPGPAGFASAKGQVAFAKHPDKVKTLLLACEVRDEKKMLPLDDIVRRLAWVYRGAGEPVEGANHKAHVVRDETGVTVVYYVRQAGQTGAIRFQSVTVQLKVDGTCVTRIEKVNAELP